ncbi:atrial natriuretic peptide-converting enzyme-like [Paramacrobiotus metropolitanus]|uniref:atrial natriuretic peptide-converting enzyme-like n=1 Tax=Paramacrobiotus metropolitanus TaxID=2943436 RepID=UPI002445EEF2|nr:atrial natriuretic peptide-converting enzyme-like [Paramacrobiotus metropolitanus]
MFVNIMYRLPLFSLFTIISVKLDKSGVYSFEEGVNIFPLSSCDDIAEVGGSTISFPPKYPLLLNLQSPRYCRFEVQNRNQVQPVSINQLSATLEFPFQLATDDALVFIDGSVRSSYPNTCDYNLFTKNDPLVKVTRPNSTSTRFVFNATGSAILIDYCGAGRGDGPISFFLVLTVHTGAMFVTETPRTRHIQNQLPVQNQFQVFNGNAPQSDIGSPMFQQAAPAAGMLPTAANGGSLPECGTTGYPPDYTRIVNGDVAHYGNFPWIAALVHKRYKQYCGATILTADWVLTAAHCIIGPLDVRDIQANTTVVIGVLDLNQATADNKYEIADLVVHPNYDPKGWLNDIALIRLKRSIPFFDATQRPACLPNRSLKDVVAATGHTQCFIAGWGYTKEGMGITVFRTPLGPAAPDNTVTSPPGPPHVGAGSDTLLYGRLNYVPLETCQQNYYTGGMLLQGAPQFVRDNMLCASNDERFQGACLGDSGGGLYCRETDHSWTVHGVSSWSGGCARKDLPSVFANVFQLKSLIQRVLSKKPSG